MENSYILRKRNRLFFNIFTAALIIQILSTIFIHNKLTMHITLFAIIYCVFLFIVQKFNMNEKWVQFFLLAGLNVYILLINIDAPYYIHVVLFIYPLFVASLYHSVIPNIILLTITLVEIVYFFNRSFDSYIKTMDYKDLFELAILFLLMGFTAIIHSLLIQRAWKWMENQHSTMERALESKEGYLHLFFENAKDSIAVFDLEGCVIEVNPAFERMYGWSREECIGNQIPIIPPENVEASVERKQQVLEGKTFHFLETKDMKKDGTYFDAQLTLSPIYNRDDELVAMSVISRDISYKKEAERMLVQSEKLKLAGEIAAGVAHEIRNPMTVISGFIQMMNQDKNGPYHSYTQLIQSELERINLIISEFLVLAKPHVTMSKEFVIEDILNDVIMLFKPELNLRAIELIEHIHSTKTFVKGEPNQIKQVFINIVKNAIDALEVNGQLIVSSSIVDTTEREITIRIKDNGVGMSSDVVKQIFEPFFTTKQTGTGLGMMISQKIIKDHGGTIHIKSKIGVGTEVSISLPYRDRKKISSS
jgi:PAS domain S-box-containing protein